MQDRPNFIVIYFDDLGYGDLGCYGADEFQTPNLDALAAGGVRFTNWYSACPVCSPSRASLLTGRYPQRTGVSTILGGGRGTRGLPADEATLARLLKAEGYRTAMLGKWHLGVSEESWPNAHGFDEFYGFLAGCVDYYSHIFYWGMGKGTDPVHDLWENRKEVWRDGEYLTEVLTAKAVEYVRVGGDKPFFLYLPYNAPHYPMHAPRKYLDRFQDLPPDRRIMAAMVAAVDDGVGEIVRALKETGQYDNTVIFVSSDNGPSAESRNWLDGTRDPYYGGSAGIFRGHKFSLFDGGIREPAILSYPRAIRPGQTCDKLAAMTDVLPTLLSLAGASAPADRVIDGKDLGPMLFDDAPSPHERLYWAYDGQLAVREGDWKLVLGGKTVPGTPPADPVHLSNLAEDPGERVNLAAQRPDLAQRLTGEVKAWFETVTRERG